MTLEQRLKITKQRRRIAALEASNTRLLEALTELMKWGVELDDDRIGYITVQVDRGAIEDARRALAGGGQDGH